MQPPNLRDEEALAEVAALKPAVVVAVAYGQILRQQFLDIPPRGVLNVHPSFLPKYRGASPIQAAILAGDDLTGVTIILMDAGMDSGPILAQIPHPVNIDDTAGSLSSRLAEAGADLLIEALPLWLAGEITPQPQDPSLATITKLLKKEDGVIDWSLPAEIIERQVRAYNPWPGAHSHLEGGILHIWRSLALPHDGNDAPGTVVSLRPDPAPVQASPRFAIQTGDGLLAPLELQREGRKRLGADDFLRGAPGLIGKRLT
jgi:methionyl-tRNA formyltransferase